MKVRRPKNGSFDKLDERYARECVYCLRCQSDSRLVTGAGCTEANRVCIGASNWTVVGRPTAQSSGQHDQKAQHRRVKRNGLGRSSGAILADPFAAEAGAPLREALLRPQSGLIKYRVQFSGHS